MFNKIKANLIELVKVFKIKYVKIYSFKRLIVFIN